MSCLSTTKTNNSIHKLLFWLRELFLYTFGKDSWVYNRWWIGKTIRQLRRAVSPRDLLLKIFDEDGVNDTDFM